MIIGNWAETFSTALISRPIARGLPVRAAAISRSTSATGLSLAP